MWLVYMTMTNAKLICLGVHKNATLQRGNCKAAESNLVGDDGSPYGVRLRRRKTKFNQILYVEMTENLKLR